MRKISFNSLMSMMLIASVISFTSCKKNLKRATASAEDNDLAEGLFNDVFNSSSSETKEAETSEVGSGKMEHPNFKLSTASCATVTWEFSNDSSYLKSVTINYGSGCTYNNRVYKGHLYITQNGRFINQGTVTTVSTGSDFYIDDYKVDGTKTVTNITGLTFSQNTFAASFGVVVSNGKITDVDGNTWTWQSTRTHTWELSVAGLFLKVDGSANGVNRDNVSYEMSVEETLVWQAGCQHVIDGVLRIKSDDVKKDILIDYGDGTCDDKATIKIGSKKPKDLALK